MQQVITSVDDNLVCNLPFEWMHKLSLIVSTDAKAGEAPQPESSLISLMDSHWG